MHASPASQDSEKCRRHGIFLCSGTEVYVGQWIPRPATVARNQIPAHRHRSDDFVDTDACSVSSSSSQDSPRGRESRDIEPRRQPIPCRDGWGVHIKGIEKYEGQWCNDMRHGLGCVSTRGAERYVGSFAEGQRSGQGITVSRTGVLWAEVWEAGALHRKRPFLETVGERRRRREQRQQRGVSDRAGDPSSGSSSEGPEKSSCCSSSVSSSPERPDAPPSGQPLATDSLFEGPHLWAKDCAGAPVVDESQIGELEVVCQPMENETSPLISLPLQAASRQSRMQVAASPMLAATVAGEGGTEVESRSSLRFMNTWSVNEVARLTRFLGLSTKSISVLRAHCVDGAAFATLVSRSAAPFLRTVFKGDVDITSVDEICASRRLLVVATELFLKHRNKLLLTQESECALTEEFADLEIEPTAITFGDVVGEGSYGTVHKARWMNADVAAKAFRHDKDGKALKNFYAELCVLHKLRHPNITLLLGLCLKPQYVIITEYLHDGSLFDLLHTKRRMQDWNFSRLVGIAREICVGMVYLHLKGVLHCDLKSGNILLNGQQEVKICDFGLAHLLEVGFTPEDETSVNIGCVGTHHWMAPEVLRGECYSKAADVYSFGMILWEMISRKVPFHGCTPAQIVGVAGYGRRRPKSPQGCPETLKAVLRMALRPRAHTRRTFLEISEELDRLHSSAVIDVEENLWIFFCG